jgi:hypothetical protein
MIITIDSPRKVIINNVYMLDPKRNMVMDGFFSKLMYSNEYFAMTGLYVLFPIEISNIDVIGMKKQVNFNPHSQTNLQIVQDFAKLEYRVLEHYKQTKQCNRKISNSLAKQMYLGNMKIYKDFNQYNKSVDLDTTSNFFLLKISGIWETSDSVGLTYKLYEIKENYI